MSDIDIRPEGRIGRITLNRPSALNALSDDMCRAIDLALRQWCRDDQIDLIMIDAIGDKAFSAGGDLAQMYESGKAGDYGYGRRFWAEEYRMNARIAAYPKPIVVFMQGFTLGGGVGLACHASHRITCESSQIALPECGVGLVPDVGGSYLLARAPGRLGDYLGTTGARMGPGDAIMAGFADHFIPSALWPALKAGLLAGDPLSAIAQLAQTPPPGPLGQNRALIDRFFGVDALPKVLQNMAMDASDFAAKTLAALARPSPLAMAATVEMLRRLRPHLDLQEALCLEYRFTYRAMQHGDFIEGIRAAIIDKDRNPRWRHASVALVSAAEVAQMLMPLGADELTFEKDNA